MECKLTKATCEVILELLGYVSVRPNEDNCDEKWEKARAAVKEVLAYHAELDNADS